MLDESDDDHTVLGMVSIQAVYLDRKSHRTLAICVCPNCSKAFIASDTHLASGKSIWPTATPLLDEENIPPDIYEALENAYRAAYAEAYLACLLACKTTLERIWHQEGASGIDELASKGLLPTYLKDQAHEVRRLANEIDHHNVPSGTLGETDCEEMLEFVSAVVRAIYVEPARLKKAAERRAEVRTKEK